MSRSSGQLRKDILDVLGKKADPVTPKGIHDDVTAISPTSEGAVRQALKEMIKDGLVKQVGSGPQTYTLASAATAPTVQATPASPPPPQQVPVVPVPRPGGGMYYPREIAGRPDIEVLRELRSADCPVLLFGPPGTGKTAVVEAAFDDLLTIAGDGDTTVADFVGEYTQKPDGTYEFVYGPMVRAMREGRALLVDDATLIPPPVMAVLYPAMDGRGQIAIKAYRGEIVTAAPGFYTIAGHNPGVTGAHLTEALASRFSVHIEVGTDYELAAQLKVPKVLIKIAKALSAKAGKGECSWAPQMRELLGARDVARLLGIEVAFKNLITIAPEDDRDTVAAVVAAATKAQHERLRLGAQIKFTTTPASTPGPNTTQGAPTT